MSVWKYEKIYDDDNIYKDKRKNSKKGQDAVQYLGQWQEIVLKENCKQKQLEWLKEILGIN